MSRMNPADASQDAVLQQTYDRITRTRGYVSNILASLSHAPVGLERFATLGEYVRYEVKVPGRTRELAILGIARGIEYGWVHHYPHALKAGVTEEELRQLKAGKLAPTLSAAEQAAVRYAQEFASLGNVADGTFAALKEQFSDRQITDLTLIAAYFVALGSIMNAFRVELEPESTLAKRKEREG
ncbi:MAG: carboxymuconolactone decarboxylase family protein [Burkholderiales bacterium]|nr:carboxymuconolactone decarboxylase family protein [Burkholderiales bacterium]